MEVVFVFTVHDANTSSAFLLQRPLEQDWWRGRLNKAWNLLWNGCEHDRFLAGTTRILNNWVVKGSEVQIRSQEKIVRAGRSTRTVQVGVRKCPNHVPKTLRAVNFGQQQRLSMWRALGSQNCFQRCKPARSQDGSVPKFVLQKCEVPTLFFFFSPAISLALACQRTGHHYV